MWTIPRCTHIRRCDAIALYAAEGHDVVVLCANPSEARARLAACVTALVGGMVPPGEVTVAALGKYGMGEVRLRGGGRIRFAPACGKPLRGARPDVIVCDEASLPPEALLLVAIGARLA